MTTSTVRDQLREQLQSLPDDIVQEVADFTAFVVARRTGIVLDWSDDEWQRFALQQFFRDDDDAVTYSLDDAEEIFDR